MGAEPSEPGRAGPRAGGVPADPPPTPAAPVYSLLVIGYRSLRFLKVCLESLLATTGPAFEILFLDNDSPEPEAEWVEAHLSDARLKVFRSETNRYFAGGMNFLAAEARGEYLVLLNPDTKAEPDWLERLDRGMKEGGYDGAQADLRMLAHPDRPESRGHFLDRAGFIVHAGPARGEACPPIFAGRGAGLALRRGIYEEAGGLDESFKMYFEETDLCWRLNLLGYRLGYVPGAVICHLKGGSSRPSFFEWSQYRFARNRVSALISNFGAGSLAVWLPAHLALAAAGALAWLPRGRPGRALTEIAALLSPWFLLGPTLAKRKRVQGTRRVSDADLVRRGMILPGLKMLGAKPG
jgi:GT2 family glycosyltransferase